MPRYKILIIRFNSIGDLILMSPVIDALASAGHELHLLTKKEYSVVQAYNPNLEKIWQFSGKDRSIGDKLKQQGFDYVLDLHNNIRSLRFRLLLGKPSLVLKKNRISDLIMRFRFGQRQKQDHIVNKFLNTAKPLLGDVPIPRPEFFVQPNTEWLDNIPDRYIAIAVSTAFATKDIPIDHLCKVIDSFPDQTFVLLGSQADVKRAEAVVDNVIGHNLISLVGTVSLHASASIIDKADLLITGDTGLMHMAAALNTKMITIFGSTHPSLGYTPFYNDPNTPHAMVQNEGLSCRPCTKQGRHSCPKSHFKCMRELSVDEICNKVEQLLIA